MHSENEDLALNGEPAVHEDALRSEIDLLEARLVSMGLDGDCAYERAMSRVYDRLLKERKRQLAAIRAAGL